VAHHKPGADRHNLGPLDPLILLWVFEDALEVTLNLMD